MRMTSRRTFGLAIGAASILASCARHSGAGYQPAFSRDSPSGSREQYTFAVHPLHNPQMLSRLFAPLMDYLGQRVPRATFRLVASRDYGAFETRLMAGEFDFALPNPLQTLRATEHGYRVFAKEANDDEFRGIVVVRRDAGVHAPEDLLGKAISYPAPTAVAATLMVQYYLQTHGLPIRRTRSMYVGSQESAISSVYLRASQAGGTWPAPWGPFIRDNPRIGDELEIKWRTDSLVNNGLVALRTVPDVIVGAVREALIELGATNAGKSLLMAMAVPGFEAATGSNYEPVREFLSRYEASLGPLHAVA